ncbi:glycosyltransferase [Halorubrum tropicale]|uniref:glycosyltransferase n=1 Tax=Halorubrum tropicale TaxID=1765655 RepID=UPI00097F9604|nr:glycosyltransferase [Halorubrum tropicale]
MDILQLNKFYYPEIGGIEQVVRALAEGMSQRGHTSRVLVSTPQGQGSHDSIAGVPITRTSSLGVAKSVPLSPTFPVRLYQASRNVDVIHHHLPNPLSVISHLTTPRTDAKTVVTYHSDIVRQQTALKFYRPFLNQFLESVDHIFVTSPRLLDQSTQLQAYRQKSSVVPLSIRLEQYQPGETEEIEISVDHERPTLLFVGRLNYYKGVEYLIDAMRSIDADLIIVGDGERRENLEERAQNLEIGNRVFFTGHINESQLHACYDRADLFVLPSVEPSEAFGIVQLEAMAYHTPVVNTDLPTGVPWVSLDGETGRTVPPGEAGELASAISELLDDDEVRAVYGKQARERVENLFTREQMLNTMESRYQAIIEGKADQLSECSSGKV